MEPQIKPKRAIEEFCKGRSADLLAEVFIKELQYVCGEYLLDNFTVVNHGMNSRVRSRDVLGVQRKDLHNGDTSKKTVLHLSRNGIYQQLPEFLFHPISISSPTMSNREVVAAIRENRKKEKEAVNFFSPFDTETFKNGVRIFNRHLGLFENPYENKILQKISTFFYKTAHAPLTSGEGYRLFLFLCQSEILKENLSALENVIHTITHLSVTLRYKQHSANDLPYGRLGDCCLGEDSGLSGPITSELDDVEAKICFERIENEDFLKKKIETVRFILSFFILSSRHIDVIYTVVANSEFVIGQNYLGYDTNL